jgi:hypothetical protein
MKQKVLTYANDGNTVVSKFMELTPVNYHAEIFTTPLEEYGRTNLVFKFKDIFYCEGNYYLEQIENKPETVIACFTNYLANLHTHKWIKNIYITLFESLGMDATQLNEVRAKQIQDKEAAKQAEIQRKANEVQVQIQKRIAELAIAKTKLAAGEKICKEDFIELVKMYNVPIHIRTIGMLNDMQKADIGINQAYIYGNKHKGKSLQKVFEAAQLLVAC